ncbi:ABZJ_00895 family protein [Gordonia sp. MMO-8]|uniref:ABZJ_00895 family protein n=1 Tax=Gordonia sp. MMO-8 TaxID=3127886 RepID=UPI0030172CF1
MNVWKYLGRYALAYVGMIVVLGVISAFVDLTASMGTVAPVVAVTFPVSRFVVEFRRVPDPTERLSLSVACIGFFVLLQIAILIGAALAYPDAASEVLDRPGMAVLVLGLGVVLPAVAMWLIIRYMPPRFLRNLEKSEARKAARRAR